MYAQLGNIAFEGLKGFDSLTSKKSVNYAEHALIEGRPRLQRVGTNLEELSISIRLHASFTDPESDISAMETAKEDGEIMPLVLGNGVFAGEYVILSLSRTLEQTDPLGNIVSAKVSLELKEVYNPDPLRTVRTEALTQGFANGDGGATPVRLLTPAAPSVGKQACVEVLAVETNCRAIDTMVTEADVFTERRDWLSGRIDGKLVAVQDGLARLNALLTQPVLTSLAGTLPTSMTAVFTAVQNFRAVLPISDMTAVKGLNTTLLQTARDMSSAAAGIKTETIARRI